MKDELYPELVPTGDLEWVCCGLASDQGHRG